ncbi:peptidase S1 and S6 chymotrypsin/Hap [Gloeothece citriformis PCC 7424]|uniref:Peptidase S1 and S6 chymotrypsin/Hap n=1 Tax=Gloeothece citriformis (strain PCC 7424) TaxID=65393 RepID=B7KAX2_GLOC7|nr:serine protease [Gloeothece citriformis]ACK70082.1 peptidase S1 and S6 chymotrypsin/Hap [Gloeothece citriformis PCC 7424]
MKKRLKGITGRSLGLILCLSIAVGLSETPHHQSYGTISHSSKNYSQKQLYQIAQSITVTILAKKEAIGSGVIIQNQQNRYKILTNAHVLQGLEPPYQIKTPDGQVYEAQIIDSVNFKKADLALLQFQANNFSYPTAKIGSSSKLIKGEPVFVSGFPYTTYKTNQNNFTFNQGTIVSVLDKALEGGYQVGYNNLIEKGMSGGPLLNSSGEVVGINGMHAYPLWETLTYYEDGTEPSSDLQQLITRSSWAIPIEKVVQLVPSLLLTFDK